MRANLIRLKIVGGDSSTDIWNFEPVVFLLNNNIVLVEDSTELYRTYYAL